MEGNTLEGDHCGPQLPAHQSPGGLFKKTKTKNSHSSKPPPRTAESESPREYLEIWIFSKCPKWSLWLGNFRESQDRTQLFRTLKLKTFKEGQSEAAITNCHRLGDFNNRNLFSHSSGARKSEIKVPAGLGSGENSSTGLRTATSSLRAHTTSSSRPCGESISQLS